MTAPPLHILLTRARAELDAETPTVLHTHFSPKLVDADGVLTHYPDEGGIGPPFTAAFHRVLALGERRHPETAVRYSLSVETVDHCRVNHPEHIPPDGGKPLCAMLVYLAVWVRDDFGDGLTIEKIAALSGLPAARVRTLLSGALEHAAAWRHAQYAFSDPVENPYANETVEQRLAREHDVAREQRIWGLNKSRYPVLSSWEDELANRRQRHKTLRCQGCPLLLEEAA